MNKEIDKTKTVTAEALLRAIGEVDEALLEEVAKAREAQQKTAGPLRAYRPAGRIVRGRFLGPLLAAAACVTVVVGMTATGLWRRPAGSPAELGSTASEQATAAVETEETIAEQATGMSANAEAPAAKAAEPAEAPAAEAAGPAAAEEDYTAAERTAEKARQSAASGAAYEMAEAESAASEEAQAAPTADAESMVTTFRDDSLKPVTLTLHGKDVAYRRGEELSKAEAEKLRGELLLREEDKAWFCLRGETDEATLLCEEKTETGFVYSRWERVQP